MRMRTLVAVLVLAIAMSLSAAPKNDKPKERWRAGQVIVKYKAGFAPAADKHGVKSAKKVFGKFRLKGKAKQHADARGLDRVYLLELKKDDVEAAVAALKKDPAVEYAEPNWTLSFMAAPDDPSYASQWALEKIGAPAAWDVQTSGTGVVVGVVDTGIDVTHPDLAANIWTNPGEIAGNNIDDDDNGFIDDVHGFDFWNMTGDTTDYHGHGTRVAGVIGAAGNNATGISGVAWTAKLAALKIGDIFPDVFSAVTALEYANMMGFKITSNSWGWVEGGMSFLLNDVIATAEADGNLFVVAAGNDSLNNDEFPSYPSHYTNPNVVSVTATSQADALSWYGNYGPVSVDLGAPGDNIESTQAGGTYVSGSGSSFSAPLVAGAATLLWTANPTLSHAAVREELMLTSEPLPSLHGKTVSGGRLSISNLFDPETIAPGAITDLTVVDTTQRSVTVRFTATGDDGSAGRAMRYDVRVSTSPITAANFATATQLTGEPVPQLPGTLETFKLSGLESSTTYYVAAKVLDNAANASAISNVGTFTTQRSAILFDDAAEAGMRDWTVQGTDGNGGPALWHIEHNHIFDSKVWQYADANDDYDTGARNWGALVSRELDLTQARDTRLRFSQFIWTEQQLNKESAQVQVSVNGGAWTRIFGKMMTQYAVRNESLDLSAYDGQHIRIRFFFDTLDAEANQYQGWLLDDIVIDAASTNAAPSASIDAVPSITEDQVATLSATGSDPENASLEYKWSFGDGSVAYTAQPSVTHVWTREGNYTVTLTAYDGSNSSDPVSVGVTPVPVNDRPVAVIGMTAAPPPLYEETGHRITYFDSSDEENSPLTCRFDYGDGTVTTQPCSGSWTHAWNAPGTYTISLVVNDGELDSLPDTEQITILEASNDAPVARAGGPYDTHPNQSVTLDGSASSDEETSIASYLWTFADGTTATTVQASKIFASPGAYNASLVVTDGTGLTSSPSVAQVRVCGGAVANLFGSTVYTCPGGTARVGINVSSGFLPLTVTWADGHSQQVTQLVNGYYAERVVTPTAATTYALASLTDFLGCAGTAGATTTTVDFASATIAGSQTICTGQSATIYPTLRGSGPYTLTWTDGFTQTGQTSQSLARTVSPSSTTTYGLASMTCASCPAGTTGLVSGSHTVTVNNDTPPVATLSGGGTSCNGSSVTLTVTIEGGTPPFSIRFSDGSSTYGTSSRTFTRSVNPAATTTYTVTHISAGCNVGTSTGSATVTRWNGTPPAVTSVTSDGVTFCAGSPASATVTANLTGDGLPFTLTWSDGFVQTAESLTATRTVTPSVTTTYSVTSIRNAAGCAGTVSGNTTVFFAAKPHVTVSGGGSFCVSPGNTVAVRAEVTGRAPWTLTWSDGYVQTLPVGSANSVWRYVAPENATTYTVTAVSDYNCSSGTSSGSATVTPVIRPTAVLSGGGEFCDGGSATISVALTGTAPFNLTWNDGFTQTVSGYSATRQVAPAYSQSYSITTVDDANICVASSANSVSAWRSAPPTAQVTGSAGFCPGSTATISAYVNGVGPVNLTWSDGFTQTANGTGWVSRQVTAAGTYTVTTVAGQYCNGTSTGSAVLTPIPAPGGAVSGTGTFCEGSTKAITATLTGTGPFTVTWSDGVVQTVSNGNIAARDVAPLAATTYTATVSDFYCSGTTSGSAVVTPTNKPVITTQPQNKTIAKRATTTLTVATTESGLSYQWYQGVSGTTTTPVGTNSATFTTPKLTATTRYWVKIWKSSCAAYPTHSATATVTVQ